MVVTSGTPKVYAHLTGFSLYTSLPWVTTRWALVYMRLRAAIDQFIEWKGVATSRSTVTGYAQDLKMFCLLLKNKEIEAITLDDVLHVLHEMRAAGWTQASLMRKCMALRKLLEFLAMLGHQVLPKELIPIPKPERTMPRVATVEHYQRLVHSIPRSSDPRHLRNRTIIHLLWDTGMRAGELVALDVKDIDTTARRATIRTEKNRGSRPFRNVFWTKATNTCLKLWITKRARLASSAEPALFICCTSWRRGKRLTNKGLGEALRRACNRAKLPYMNPHSFRHAVGHEIIKNGGSNTDVAQALGHTSLLSTYVYTQLSDTEQERRYRRLRG